MAVIDSSREQRRAPEGEQRLAEEQAHDESRSGFSSAALSYTTPPSCSSIVR